MLYPASDIDWRFSSYMIVYMLEFHSPKSSHPLPLPLSPKVRYTLIDTGATYSVLPSFGGTLHPSQVSVVGIDGTSSQPLQTGPQPCQLYQFLFTHSFLIIPSCPTPLLGRDILAKLRATIHLPLSFSQSLTFPLLLLCSPESPVVDPNI